MFRVFFHLSGRTDNGAFQREDRYSTSDSTNLIIGTRTFEQGQECLSYRTDPNTAGRPRVRVPTPVKDNRYVSSLSLGAQARSGRHSNSVSFAFFRGKLPRDMKVTNQLHLVIRLRLRGARTLLLHIPLVVMFK